MSTMTDTAALTPLGALLQAYSVLEGADSYTMGDPGDSMSATSNARTALFLLLKEHGVNVQDESWEESQERGRGAHDPISALAEALKERDKAGRDERFQAVLTELENADRPLTELSADDARTLIAQAHSVQNTEGHRSNAIYDVARYTFLIERLNFLADTLPESHDTRTLRQYALDLGVVRERTLASYKISL